MNDSQTHVSIEASADASNAAIVEGIAVIGMSGRFPRSRDVGSFWQNLQDGVECITVFSDEELLAAGVDAALIDNPNYVKARGVLEDVELFDAAFFGLNPREAEVIDPQHRIFLECAWEALESAGYDPHSYAGPIGVYAGASMNTYLLFNLLSNPETLAAVGGYQTMIGNDKDFMPTRVSYKLNLRGPSVNVQTACSTSLVAVQMACQSLLNYQCDMAVAGGVSVAQPRKTGYLYQEGMILSPDGHCRAFDAAAQGTVGGEGVGAVILKRMADALADGDSILAVIKGAAVNNDGSLKVGYTAPSVDGQAEVIAMAQAAAGVDAESITYVEAHGTGTPLGDPIEIAALTQAFRAGTQKTGFCAIGSVKTNIGHLDSAAGVAGLIKTVLALQHRLLPPSLHYQQPNPKIDFERSPFYVNARPTPWQTGKLPRRAGVSSFGIGGTNAHVVVEEAPELPDSPPARPWQLLALSARTESALDQATHNLTGHLREQPGLNLADAAYTLQVGRRPFAHRRIVVCGDAGDAAAALETPNSRRVFTAVAEGTRDVAFMFTGQGSQYVNMGLELYGAEPLFREQVDRCSEILKPHLGFDLRDALYPKAEQAEWAARQIHQTAVTQPALFVIEYALAKLWMEWGVRPLAMIGHSIGEYVAACLAGVFSLEDGLRLVAARGRLMQSLPPGAMLSVPLPEQEARSLLGDHAASDLSLAVVNAPSLCVVSGPIESVDALQHRLEDRGVPCRRLLTSHAFHSAMMDPILAAFTAEVSRVALNPPAIPFVSNVTGAWITGAQATDPGYWATHLRQTVRFADGVREVSRRAGVLLEVGPGQTLSTLAQQQLERSSTQAILRSLRQPNDPRPDTALLLETLGRLWLEGVDVNWPALYARERRRRIPLPTYPFERQRFWVEPRAPASHTEEQLPSPGLPQQLPQQLPRKADIADWFYVPSWKRCTPPQLPEWSASTADRPEWLIFTDEYGLGARMAERLLEQGHKVISVHRGEHFSRQGNGDYELNPQSSEDYAALIKDLRERSRMPGTIAHLWNYSGDKQPVTDLGTLQGAQALGFYSLLYLAQALGEHAPKASVRIGVISNNLHEVTGEEELDPAKATLLGPCKVIPHEYPGVFCCSIDVPPAQPGSRDEERWANQVLAELLSNASDPIVAYRGRYRWVQSYEAQRLPQPDGLPALLRPDGVYLITGGLGGIGLALAEHLARSGPVKLVLTGRTALPDREEWPGWLAGHEDHDPSSIRIRGVQALEALGAQVLVLGADAADPDAMRSVMTRTLERFGRINGVIHAAGLPGGGMIQLKSPQVAASVLAPKVAGTLILDQLLSDASLDFLVLCSSINSVVSGFGQVDYSAANAFLDAFAHSYRARHGTPCVAINWDTWQEVGMAVNVQVPADLQKAKEENLKHGLLTQEGQDAFTRILGRPAPQVVVSTRDLNRMLDIVRDRVLNNMLDSPIEGSGHAAGTAIAQGMSPGTAQAAQAPPKNGAGKSAQHHPRPALRTAYVAPQDELEQSVAAIWRELLGIDPIGACDDFFELGGHSLLAVQVISRLRETFRVELPLRSLFEATTVQDLAQRLKTILWVAREQSNAPADDGADREEIEL